MVAELFFLLDDSCLIDSGLENECDSGGVGSVVRICVMFTSVSAAFPNARAAAINKGSGAFCFRAIKPPIAAFLSWQILSCYEQIPALGRDSRNLLRQTASGCKGRTARFATQTLVAAKPVRVGRKDSDGQEGRSSERLL